MDDPRPKASLAVQHVSLRRALRRAWVEGRAGEDPRARSHRIADGITGALIAGASGAAVDGAIGLAAGVIGGVAGPVIGPYARSGYHALRAWRSARDAIYQEQLAAALEEKNQQMAARDQRISELQDQLARVWGDYGWYREYGVISSQLSRWLPESLSREEAITIRQGLESMKPAASAAVDRLITAMYAARDLCDSKSGNSAEWILARTWSDPLTKLMRTRNRFSEELERGEDSRLAFLAMFSLYRRGVELLCQVINFMPEFRESSEVKAWDAAHAIWNTQRADRMSTREFRGMREALSDIASRDTPDLL